MKAPVPYLETLGSFRLTESGRTPRIPRTKEKALIAFLAVNAGHAFQRDYLAGLLWMNSHEDNGKHSLNNAIYTIKRAFPSLLTVTLNSVAISTESIRPDLEELTRHIKEQTILGSLALIRGEFLADLDLRDSPDFEQWRSDFNRQLFFDIEAGINAELERLSPAERRSANLQLSVLAAVCPTLRISTDVIATTEVLADADATDEQTSTSFHLPFVGRERQLAALHQLWTDSTHGAARFVNVRGHPGHGKTRLVDEFIGLVANEQKTILRARCYRSERRIAFGPIVEMITRGVTERDLTGIESIWLSALQEVIPMLPVRFVAAPQLSAIASQSRLYEAILRVIAHMAERSPVIVFLDDIQWADESTQAFLSFLSHRISASVLVIVAERINASTDAHEDQPWRAWPSITVEELSARQLAEALNGLPAGISRIAPSVPDLDRLTRGHPYLVTEVIRSAVGSKSGDDGTADSAFVGVDAFLGSILSELPDEAQRVASALAVIGRPAPIFLVAKVCKTSDATVGLNILLEKGLVDDHDGKVSLRHDLLRESTYKRLPVFTRNELHRRVAAALSTNAKSVGECAEHYYRGRDRRNAYTFAVKAAKAADARYANDDSIYFLRMAIKAATGDRERLHVLLAERMYRANRKSDTIRQIQRITSQPSLLSPIELVTWKLRALELGYDSGTVSGPEMRKELDGLRSRIPKTETSSLTQMLYLRTQSAFHDGDRSAAAAAQYTLKAIAEEVGPADGILPLANAVHGHATVSSASEADGWAEPLRNQLASIDDPELKIKVFRALTSVAYAAGRLREASHYTDQALQEIERVGAMNLWPLNAAHSQMLHIEQGRFVDAARMHAEIKSRTAGFLDVVATASANASLMYYAQGDFDQARSSAEWGINHLQNRTSTWTELVLRGLSGISALQLGDMRSASVTADYAKDKIDKLGTRIIDLSYVEILIARAATLRGQKQAAMDRLQEAIKDYTDRDMCCRLRMLLELARMLKAERPDEARALAKTVYQTAREANAVLIADGADSLLARL